MDGIYTFKVKGTAFYPIMIGLWTCLVVELWWNILELSIKCVYAFLQLVLEILDCNVCLHFGYLMVVEFHCTLLLVSVEFIVLILFSNGHWLDDRRLTWWLDGPFRSAILSLHYSGQIVCWLSWWLDCASHKVSLGVGHSPSTSTKRGVYYKQIYLGSEQIFEQGCIPDCMHPIEPGIVLAVEFPMSSLLVSCEEWAALRYDKSVGGGGRGQRWAWLTCVRDISLTCRGW